MPNEITPPQIRSEESPREILAADFPSIRELPIHGGWGYSLDDAVTIDKADPVAQNRGGFDGVGIEHIFVEKRIYEELIILRAKDDRYSGISWDVFEQKLLESNGHHYDVLKVKVTAFPEVAWEALRIEWEGPNGFNSPAFDIQAHMRKRESSMVHYTTKYYFDIMSFFGGD